MKSLLFTSCVFIFSIVSVLPQGQVFGRRPRSLWETNTPLPLTVTEAHSLAIANLGLATNHFYCVTASCGELTNGWFGGWSPRVQGWTFSFADTNGRRASVCVSFDKQVSVDDRDGRILASHVVIDYPNCIAALRATDGATQMWALEEKHTTTDIPTDADLFGPGRYLPHKPRCPQGGSYTFGTVEKFPRCSIPNHTL